MLGVILIVVLNVAMFTWFSYLAAKDPSNVFKRRRPPREDSPSTDEASTTPPEA